MKRFIQQFHRFCALRLAMLFLVSCHVPNVKVNESENLEGKTLEFSYKQCHMDSNQNSLYCQNDDVSVHFFVQAEEPVKFVEPIISCKVKVPDQIKLRGVDIEISESDLRCKHRGLSSLRTPSSQDEDLRFGNR